MRITKITTKSGDGGKTKLGDGQEVSKSDLRIKCIGQVDELNSFIGYAKVATTHKGIIKDIVKIQNQLLNLGGEISVPEKDLNLITDSAIILLDERVHELNSELAPLREFVVPGEDEFSARLHIARTVCRRVETLITELIEKNSGKKIWIQYLNRLSDYLFVLSRYHLDKNGVVENQWERNK